MRRSPDFDAPKNAVRQRVILDGGKLHDPGLRQQRFEYHAIGR